MLTVYSRFTLAAAGYIRVNVSSVWAPYLYLHVKAAYCMYLDRGVRAATFIMVSSRGGHKDNLCSLGFDAQYLPTDGSLAVISKGMAPVDWLFSSHFCIHLTIDGSCCVSENVEV